MADELLFHGNGSAVGLQQSLLRSSASDLTEVNDGLTFSSGSDPLSLLGVDSQTHHKNSCKPSDR